ncbi:MAG TPA: family 1 glycosylhydrolase [Cytophagaceae bacterium]|jgi:dTDP-4-dehydrorhamnose reductase
MQQVEIWGGIESTVNRVGDQFFDQSEISGHAKRPDDLRLIAEMGIKKLRYPVLWERIAPNGLATADWSWTDERLNLLKELGITPIVGLVHHGSGPSNTSLVDPDFPYKLAEFAKAVCERYPWLEYFTPVNEPLTTARFSGLYGFWYPHGKSKITFCRTFLIQIKAVIEAMRAIKKVIPHAKLVQTEDLGKTYSTPKLAYQANFENHRRWLTYDFLVGTFNKQHYMWKYFRDSGIQESDLQYFAENHHTPDIIGVNHYITSERYLDQRLYKYPSWTYGGNGKDVYADVEAVRACTKGICGIGVLLEELFERYPQNKVAVTEVHLGCTRDEQLRWIKEIYTICNNLKNIGRPIEAITAWSMFGAYNWNSLLTSDDNYYESGIFDLRSQNPRPTILSKYITETIKGNSFTHPVLEMPGWWRRDDRLEYHKDALRFFKEGQMVATPGEKTPILITGARGTLGKAFAKLCDIRAIPYILLSRQDMDIADMNSVIKVITEYHPWAIINAAGYVRVDEAETDQERCLRENALGPTNLAKAANSFGVKLLTFSSDLVFDGLINKPYVESDTPRPLNVYGISKMQAEKDVLSNNNNALVIRTSAFFGPWDEYNFANQAIGCVSRGGKFRAASDNIVSPTYVPDLVNACLDLLIDNESGIWHLSNPSEVTWADFATMAVQQAGLDPNLIEPCDSKKLGLIAGRPLYSALSSERGILLPNLENALKRYLDEKKILEEQEIKTLIY